MNENEIIEPIETIAIVGMSGRFPKAANINEFWENLKNSKESISFFSAEELLQNGVESRQLSNPNYVKAKAFIEDIDKFDAAFFGYSPREAALMDPQHRFFLECAWEALEDSGHNPETYNGAIGLFAGVSLNSYLILNLLSDSELLYNDGILQTSLPNRTDHLTTRVAYKLNLKGPAVTIQTACSTSLVAVHLACQSLLNYQSDLALAGGVTISVPNKSGYVFQEGGVLSPDGHCRAFDVAANGTTVGNGVGLVVLKRLSEALKDGDQIYAVIKGSAINNDGANKVGFTAPSVEGQIEVITTALQIADVEASSISYIETHGTGTSLGDPIEIQALSAAFRHNKNKSSCALGSVKTNIGHLDVAAGVTGLIKTALALKNKQIPASLNFSQPNPHIDFENNCFYVNTELKQWESNGTPRRAGVSSFGIGGTNAHVVLEEFQLENKTANRKPYHLILLSAQTQGALEKATSNLFDYLKNAENSDMGNVAYTLQTGRKHFKYRRSFACKDRQEALFLLEKLDPKKVFTGLQEPKPRPVVFMFTGQGAQYAGMGSELYKNEKVFRDTVDYCALYLEPKLNLDIRELLFAQNEMHEVADAQLSQTQLTQPALFIIEYALAKQLEFWNITPQAMIGHSIGEYVAACLAGVFSLEDCLDLVSLRGRLMQEVEKGSMLSVTLSEKEILKYLNENLSLSAINSPNLCVIGGNDFEIEKLSNRLNEDGVDCRILKTSHAFHSKMMEPILDAFKEAVAKVKCAKPMLPFVSNVTGTWISETEAVSPQYWANHLRNTVRFNDGIVNFFDDPNIVLLEVGPGQTLMTIARWHLQKGTGQKVLTTLPQPNERGNDLEFLLSSIGRLWLLGVEPAWGNLNESENPQKISLPTYPFDKQSHWIKPRQQNNKFQIDADWKKKEDLSDWFYVTSWYRTAPVRNLTNQKLDGKTILCFVPENQVGNQIADEFEENGAKVIKIFAGENFNVSENGLYHLNPDNKQDFIQILQYLARKGVIFSTILYGWGIYSSETNSELNLGKNFYGPLYLIQALGEIDSSENVEMIFVTNDMNSVTGAENTFPSKSLLLSFGKVATMEYPKLKIRNLDFSLKNIDEGFSKNELTALINEFLGIYDEKIVSYRHGHRWLQKFENKKLPLPLIDKSRLKQNGVYLITGGFGGVGLTLAKYLAEKVKGSLVLIGRTQFPARDEWANILSESKDNKITKQIEKIIEIEKLGGKVLAVSANVADLESMKIAVAESIKHFGQIDGVVHCAGVPAGGMIQLKEKSVAESVLLPKVQGMEVIEKLFHDKKLDFLAICSSRNSIIGGFGQIDYCAANNFCDAFAYYYSKRYDTFAVSINWDAWQEVGMLVETAAGYGIKDNGNNRNLNGLKKNVKPIIHPLLGSVFTETNDTITFISEHNIGTQWVLDEHRIGSNPVIPGVTYLEMARAAIEYKEGDTPIKISEVYFITPVSMKDDETRFLKFSMEKENNFYNFTVLSCKDNYADENAEWREHIVGKVEVVQEEKTVQHNLKKLINRCSLKQLNSEQHELDPDLGARWQNIKRAYLGKDEYLIHFELNSEFANDLKIYKLHPSLLDRAAGTGMLYLDLDAVYLPFSYKNLLYRKPLTENIYAHIIQTETYKKGMETVTFDVIITDEAGNELVKIEEFSEKRINNLSEKIKTIAKEGSTIARKTEIEKNGSNFYEESLQEGISPHEGAEVFSRILTHFEFPQIIVSTRDLYASIEKANNFTQETIAKEIDKIKKNTILQPRPLIKTEYIAPRNETEEKLAAIMSELLGISKIGIEDNFFELGGDSVLSIQIISKAKKNGMHLTPQQVFQHPTIAELASIVSILLDTEESEIFTTEFELVDFDAGELDSIASMIKQEN